MNDSIGKLILDVGALGLLAYLIRWMTQVGGPALFSCLGGIQEEIRSINNRLELIERDLKDLKEKII